MTSLDIELAVWDDLSPADRAATLRRPVQSQAEAIRDAVSRVIAEVRAGGDQAVRALTERFDRVALDALEVSASERARAAESVRPEARRAIERALANIESFHRAQLRQPIEHRTGPGVVCMRQSRPIERVGLYVPGGTAPLVSTALMLAVPARVAGCPVRVLCTPPRAGISADDDRDAGPKSHPPGCHIDPHILLVAELTGIDRVFQVGGAQAIAAMAFGTETIPGVDKVFGPGNAYVTEAKLQCAQAPDGAALDLPAGPSEVLVIADDTANPAFVAADLLSQAEHDAQSQVVLVATDAAIARDVLTALASQLDRAPRRDIAAASLRHARFLIASDVATAMTIANQYGPEHLILQVARPRRWIPAVTCAGSVFLGPWTPEAVGDYASGTNHVLPTYGYARSYSGLSIDAFTRTVTFQELSAEGIRDLGPTVEILAELEGLDAHKQAVSLRLAELESRDAADSEAGKPGGGAS